MTLEFNTINLDAMILPDKVLHEDGEALAKLAAMRRELLLRVAGGQVRFIIAAGRKFRLEPWFEEKGL
jgi:hypothetical protein